MTSKDFISKFKDYLSSLPNGSTFGEWEYQTPTNISYSNLSESWDPDKFKGYEFKHGDGKYDFVLRPIILSDKEYLIVDCLFKNKTILNHWLDEYRFKNENNKTTLMDAYIMNYGGRQKNDAVEAAMNKVGAASSGIIYEVEDSEINFEEFTIKFLDWVKLREMAKKYIVADDSFAGVIEKLKDSISSKKTLLSNFSFDETRDGWVWISDDKNIIGNKLAHYEVIQRRKKVSVELHFESNKKKEKDQFHENMPPLPEGLEWFGWSTKKGVNAGKSILVLGEVNLNDPQIIDKLSNKLIFLEESIGDQVRAIITNKSMPPLKESNVTNPSEMNKDEIELNQILFGPPGTGKTYNTINHAISIIEKRPLKEVLNEKRDEVTKRFKELLITDWEKTNGQIGFVTFHQSMSYEDFIEGIKPKTSNKKVLYDVIPGIFKNINRLAKDNWLDAKRGLSGHLSFEEAFNNLQDEWEENPDMKFPLRTEGHDFTILEFGKSSIRFKKASGGSRHTLSISTLSEFYYKTREINLTGVGIYYPPILEKLNSYKSPNKEVKEVKPYVLIIDEINRGNVSQIFGELITLLESDKRHGEAEGLELSLPYSKDPFSVAPNLYIIGTMNTADRSVEALDTALRRRFTFLEMPPLYDELRGNYAIPNAKLKISGKEIDLIELLEVINKRINILLDRDHLIGHSYFLSVKDENGLKKAFSKQIIPLLQEYFYGDYGKISLVLGEEFCKGEKVGNLKDVFAEANNYDADGYSEKMVYTIADVTAEKFDIGEAISTLLNIPKEQNNDSV